MSDKQLRDELITMVAAGHETTANALSFALLPLCRSTRTAWRGARGGRRGARRCARRSSRGRARACRRRAARGAGDAAALPAGVDLRAATRSRTTSRRSLSDPEGRDRGHQPVRAPPHPALWENPEGFNPDALRAREREGAARYAYMPFGGGPRTCIGNVFAMTEMAVVLAMIARRFRLELVPGYELELDPSVTLRPKDGIPMRARRDETPATIAELLEPARRAWLRARA